MERTAVLNINTDSIILSDKLAKTKLVYLLSFIKDYNNTNIKLLDSLSETAMLYIFLYTSDSTQSRPIDYLGFPHLEVTESAISPLIYTRNTYRRVNAYGCTYSLIKAKHEEFLS